MDWAVWDHSLDRDVIEETALNEKSCIQVLEVLISNANAEILELEEDLIILKSQLAWADESWSETCSAALNEKIDCLDISLRSLENADVHDEPDFVGCLLSHREPAEKMHRLLQPLVDNYFNQEHEQITSFWEYFLTSIFYYPLIFFLLIMGFSSRSKRSKFDFLLTNPISRRPYDQSDDEQSESASLPSPSLVPVPVQFVVGSIKERLPITKYGYGTEKEGGHDCAICLKSMREGDEVRELCNGCHMFHKECLDSWIDQGQMTCPLCRSNLSPSDQNGEESKCGGDPWRRERMMYLFGEDFVFQ